MAAIDKGRPGIRKVGSSHGFAGRFEVPARVVMSASWWIDRRDTDPADMAEPLADVSAHTEACTADNRC